MTILMKIFSNADGMNLKANHAHSKFILKQQHPYILYSG